MATWIAAIADNVKNPIAAIGAVLDRTESCLDDPRVVERSLAQIRKRLASLNEYVSELSDFARPAVVRLSPATVSALVEDAVAAASLPAACSVEVDVAIDFGLFVDTAKLALVLKALLRNGYEAVDPTRAPRLKVSARATNGKEASISVEDNGPGLPMHDVETALEPFSTTKEAGTGLGLAIARKYVEAHGGHLTFDRSETLGGCRVVLTLPSVTRLAEDRKS
jgi:nitrogen fixation/metabolism regulation signal transduction histidine kinase